MEIKYTKRVTSFKLMRQLRGLFP